MWRDGPNPGAIVTCTWAAVSVAQNDRLLQFKLGFSHLLFPFVTLRLITDEEKYRALTALRAQAANVPVDDLLNAEYFPAYRAPLQQPVEKPV